MDVKEEMKLRQWAQDMSAQKDSGLTQKQWCETRGIKLQTFEYRCKRVRDAMEEKLEKKSNEIIPTNTSFPEPAFAKVTLTAPPKYSSGIDIQFSDTKIHISPDADPEHLPHRQSSFQTSTFREIKTKKEFSRTISRCLLPLV